MRSELSEGGRTQLATAAGKKKEAEETQRRTRRTVSLGWQEKKKEGGEGGRSGLVGVEGRL